MKKITTLILTILLIAIFTLFALGSSSSKEDVDLGTGETAQKDSDVPDIADCTVDIQSCRLAQDWEGKDVVIVKYAFTNNSDQSKSFTLSFDDEVFQDGIGLNESYVLADSAKYSADNQSKEIKKGATLEVEVAYELNDTTTDITVEVSELFSFDDSKITKTFSIS